MPQPDPESPHFCPVLGRVACVNVSESPRYKAGGGRLCLIPSRHPPCLAATTLSVVLYPRSVYPLCTPYTCNINHHLTRSKVISTIDLVEHSIVNGRSLLEASTIRTRPKRRRRRLSIHSRGRSQASTSTSPLHRHPVHSTFHHITIQTRDKGIDPRPCRGREIISEQPRTGRVHQHSLSMPVGS